MLRLSSRNALSIAAAIVLIVGCNGSQGAFSPAAGVQNMLRASGEVQYLSDFSTGTLTEFDYPKSTSPIGQITGVSDANGECTTGHGTFWVVASGANEVEEFKAGGNNPIATQTTKAGEPSGCAVDATTSNLAVTIISNGDVTIFKPGDKPGRILKSGLLEAFFDGYDAKGNLFADGLNGSAASQLVELPKGKTRFENISVSMRTPGGSVQWDGKYLAIGGGTAIYRYSIVGKKATLKGTVPLNGSSDCVQTWIVKDLVFCADAGNEEGLVYKYPAGGSAIATLSGSFQLPAGVVSLSAR
jgi:hypothetical protein